MANLQDTFGGGSSDSSSSQDSGSGTNTDDVDAPRGARRAVESTPEPAPSEPDQTSDDVDAPRGAQRAVENTPEPASSEPEPQAPRGAQRAVDQTPEPASPPPATSGSQSSQLSPGGVGQGIGSQSSGSDITAGGAGQGYTSGDYQQPDRDAPEKSEDLTERFTSGGFIDQETEEMLASKSNEFSGAVGDYVDRSSDFNPGIIAERKVIDVGQDYGFNFGPLVKDGEGLSERTAESFGEGAIGAVNPFDIALSIEAGAEIADDVPGVVTEGRVGDALETGQAVGNELTSSAIDAFKSDPVGATAGAAGAIAGGFFLGGGAVAGAKASGATTKLGSAARRLKGSKKIDSPVGEDVRKYYEDGDSSGSKFPGFDTRDGESITDTFRRQADEHTPDEVKDAFGGRGSDETFASHMTQHDFDSEFDAGIPKSRRSDPADTQFFAPESNVYFAGFGKSGGYSIRPRIPRKGDFFGEDRYDVRTRIRLDEEPDYVRGERATQDAPAATLDELGPDENPDFTVREDTGDAVLSTPGDESKFLADADPGTLFVRSKANRNLGEAEGVVSTGTKFREITGSDKYHYEFGGENVDVRLFEPIDSDDLVKARKRADAGEETGIDFDNVYDYDEVADISRRSDTPEGSPYIPGAAGSWSSSAGSGSSGSSSVFDFGTYGPPSSGGSSSTGDSFGDFFSGGGSGGSSSSGGSGGSGGPPGFGGPSGGGSSDSFGSGGGSGGGGIPGLSGGGAGGPLNPFPTNSPTKPRREREETEKKPKNKDSGNPFAGSFGEVLVDFRNPLTGERLKTESVF